MFFSSFEDFGFLGKRHYKNFPKELFERTFKVLVILIPKLKKIMDQLSS